MRILAISQNYHLRGGSDRIFLETNRLLTEHGHQVIPFTAQDERNLPTPWARHFPPAANFERPGLIDLFRYIYSLPARRALEILLKEIKPDLAHLHIYYGKLTASILAPLKTHRIPVVQTLHEYKLICPAYTLVSGESLCEACKGGHFYHALPRRCKRNSLARTALSVLESYVSHWLGAQQNIDHFIAVSHFMRSKMIEHGLPPSKITTIYNFVNVTTAPQDSAASHPGSYLLYFGRIERIKGIWTLLRAASSLRHVPLKIVGEGTASEDVKAFIQRQGLSHIHYMGFKSGADLSTLIRGSLGVVVPSQWYEPFGLSIVESFALGKPVIGSAIGAIPELITDGKDGFLFPPGNPDELRKKMQWLASHPQQAFTMGQAGQEKARTLFTPERYYQDLMNLYTRILGSD